MQFKLERNERITVNGVTVERMSFKNYKITRGNDVKIVDQQTANDIIAEELKSPQLPSFQTVMSDTDFLEQLFQELFGTDYKLKKDGEKWEYGDITLYDSATNTTADFDIDLINNLKKQNRKDMMSYAISREYESKENISGTDFLLHAAKKFKLREINTQIYVADFVKNIINTLDRLKINQHELFTEMMGLSTMVQRGFSQLQVDAKKQELEERANKYKLLEKRVNDDLNSLLKKR